MVQEKLLNVPGKPGVYIFKGQNGKVLYVGKAKKLKNRLRTYFQKAGNRDPRKASMGKLIKDFSYITTDNELEALILEANLIKQYKPRFNVILRDDKNYPYLKLTEEEQWPRIEVVRKITKDNSLYFGPYVHSHGMRDALDFIGRVFPIRTCKNALDKPMRPCIQYQMGRCVAPCANRISRDEYMKIVDEVKLFLKGERKGLLAVLGNRMTMLSGGFKFEEAAKIRDRIRSLKQLWETQKIIAPELGDIDVIGFYSDDKDALLNILFIRNGMLTGTKDFFLRDIMNVPNGEILRGFMEMFYVKEIIPPGEIIIADKPDDLQGLKAWLSIKKNGKVEIRTAKRGKRFKLLKMAAENAAQIFKDRKTAGADDVLAAIRDRFDLPCLPRDIGAFDISNTSGNEAVGAFICWSGGEFSRNMYRHVKIKNAQTTDDYSMMREAIAMILKNLGGKVPGLIVIDGGRGHLDMARAALETNIAGYGESSQPMLIAIAKNPDRVFTLTGKCISLEDRSHSSLFLKKIRDEVHRFAISYHRKLRDNRIMASPLEKIHGIGKKRRLELLRHFGSIDAIRNSAVDEIMKLKGFDRKLVQTLLMELKRK